MIKVHKTKIYPTKKQAKELHKAFAASRYAWNKSKEIYDKQMLASKKAYKLNRDFKFLSIRGNKKDPRPSIKNVVLANKPDWAIDVGMALHTAIDDFNKSISQYWKKQQGKIAVEAVVKRCPDCGIRTKVNGLGAFYTCGGCHKFNPIRRDEQRRGYPHWRKISKHMSFYTISGLKFNGKTVSYNRKVGFIKMAERLRFSGKPKGATFRYDGVNFWIAVSIEVDENEPKQYPKRAEFVGTDVGVKNFATTSKPLRNGTNKVENPKALKRYEAKLARLQRKLDRQRRANNPDHFDKKGRFKRNVGQPWIESGQMQRTRQTIKKIHLRIANIRNDTQHQLTSQLTKDFSCVGIEDLNVKGMLKNKRLAKHIADVGFGEIRRQIEYKGEWYECKVVLADRFFASSKICSHCKIKNDKLTQNDRVWICDNCGTFHDRDENAAQNLENEARKNNDQ